MDQIGNQLLHVFSINLGVKPAHIFAEVFCVMYAVGV